MMNDYQKMFVLDSSVFIEAQKRYYAFDIAPTFWKKLIELAKNGNICSIDRVKKELLKGNDDLKQWAENSFDSYFHSTENNEILKVYTELMEWSNSKDQFTKEAKYEFAQGDIADAWLISYARANNCIIATEERFNPNKKSKILIPNVCKEFNIEYVDTFQMLRQLKIQL